MGRSAAQSFTTKGGDGSEGYPIPNEYAEEMRRDGNLGLVKNPICRRFFYFFRLLGTSIAMVSFVADFIYAFKQTFASKDIFLGYLILLAIRCILPFLLVIKNICCRVCIRQNNLLGEEAYFDGYDI